LISSPRDASFVLLRTPSFPLRIDVSVAHSYRAIVGLGGNIGDVVRRFEHLLIFLKRQKLLVVESTSAILKNPPFGYLAQNAFYNAVMVVRTSMTPVALMRYLLRIEARFGRRRTHANAPRTLDLDLLFFEGRVIDTAQLRLPHPAWGERLSVLMPMVTLA